jgi:hypothetical protein
VVIVNFSTTFSRFPFVFDDPLHVSRLIQWNPAPAPATTPAMVGDSSGSSSYSHSPSSHYSDRDVRRFKAERNETRCELGDFSKKAEITELDWEHQRKQLLEAIDGESCDLFKFNSTLNKPPLLRNYCRPRCRAQLAGDVGEEAGGQGERSW